MYDVQLGAAAGHLMNMHKIYLVNMTSTDQWGLVFRAHYSNDLMASTQNRQGVDSVSTRTRITEHTHTGCTV